ncbi:MAG: hypothetical protein N2748_04825 [candidate division WOR-3 bacterium]|nr:hypothetical protein [candidate division WOR-3 bacterium]
MLAIILTISLFFSLDTVEITGIQNIHYRLFTSDSNLYFQYKINKHWSVAQKIDEEVSEYKMAVTDGDYIHIVWIKQGRVYYKMNIYPVTKDSLKKQGTPRWECSIAISIPDLTEPASNISIGVDGEYLYATWQSPLAGNPSQTEKWRRARRLGQTPFDWNTPRCLSESINRNLINGKAK